MVALLSLNIVSYPSYFPFFTGITGVLIYSYTADNKNHNLSWAGPVIGKRLAMSIYYKLLTENRLGNVRVCIRLHIDYLHRICSRSLTRKPGSSTGRCLGLQEHLLFRYFLRVDSCGQPTWIYLSLWHFDRLLCWRLLAWHSNPLLDLQMKKMEL